jgi:hypothetical protein
MSVAAYLLLVAVLAHRLPRRLALLDGLSGLPGYLAGFGATLFCVTWFNFLAYVLLGWGLDYVVVVCGGLAFAVLVPAVRPSPAPPPPSPSRPPALASLRAAGGWFWLLLALVASRFYFGLLTDAEGHVWANFNFVDTAFHLSVANAFLDAPRFPPVDLDMAPYPLKYHFLADFFVAHLATLGLPALEAMWLMNVVGAVVLVGAFWAVLEKWLRLPPRWLFLAALLFFFLNPALLNLLHWLWLQPPFYRPETPFYGLFFFPYFNFEAMLTNLLEPQRGLVFALPVALLVLHACFGRPAADPPGDRRRAPEVFAAVCLLPFAHIVSFAVLAACAVPLLVRAAADFARRWSRWLPFLALGVLQLLYLGAYGPPAHPAWSEWDATRSMPLGDFGAVPAWLRRPVFWFFVNGDFFGWGAVFAALAWWRPAAVAAPGAAAAGRAFLLRWRWFFAVTLGAFAVINFYRYSFFWGDSNKFVLYLNLGLALVIALGAARWLGSRRAWLSHALWTFFVLLCVVPHTYGFYANVLARPHGKILLFERNGMAAAAWLDAVERPGDLVVTAAYNTLHFVTPLAGLPTLAGIYGDSNPYRQDDRGDLLRRLYEQADFAVARQLGGTYVCVSRNERRKYRLHPRWSELMQRGVAAFHAGGGPEDHHSVFIFHLSHLPP